MAIIPDNSHFTACVAGEATPGEQASFDAALLADPGLHKEAAAIRETGCRLAEALRGETPVGLTPLQRQGVQEFPNARTAMVRRVSRAPWWRPTLVTAGIAAAIVLGLFALPGVDHKSPPPDRGSGIPSVAIQPGPVGKSGMPPIVLPPPILKSAPPGTMPEGTAPAGPARREPSSTMAATPFRLQLPPVVPFKPESTADPRPPRQPPAGKTTPVESFGRPRVLPP